MRPVSGSTAEGERRPADVVERAHASLPSAVWAVLRRSPTVTLTPGDRGAARVAVDRVGHRRCHLVGRPALVLGRVHRRQQVALQRFLSSAISRGGRAGAPGAPAARGRGSGATAAATAATGPAAPAAAAGSAGPAAPGATAARGREPGSDGSGSGSDGTGSAGSGGGLGSSGSAGSAGSARSGIGSDGSRQRQRRHRQRRQRRQGAPAHCCTFTESENTGGPGVSGGIGGPVGPTAVACVCALYIAIEPVPEHRGILRAAAEGERAAGDRHLLGDDLDGARAGELHLAVARSRSASRRCGRRRRPSPSRA